MMTAPRLEAGSDPGLTPGVHRGRDPWLAVLVAVCSAALLTPLLWPAVTGRVFAYNDLSWFHLPVRYLYHQALQAGDSILWTPSIFAGLYLHGEGQAGLMHPFHQLLYRLFPLGTAFNLELFASYPVAFGGMFWFLRRLRFARAAALFGAMLFAFSGFNLLHHHHMNMVAVVAHMPWLLGTADVMIADERRRARTLAFAGLALLTGSGLLLGFPQGVWWNLIALGAFAVFRAWETRRWRPLIPCAGAVVLGVLLGGVQLLPTIDAAVHSERAEPSPDFALTFSLHPVNLFQLWSPYSLERGAYASRDYFWFHEFGIYSGAILPVALAWVWIRRRALAGRRALITAVTAFAAILLVLALGRYGGLAWLFTYLPVLRSLRAPVRYIVLVQFALAILAALTLDDLLAIAAGRTAPPGRRKPGLWIPLALGIVTTIALNTGVLPPGEETFARVGDAAPGVAMVGAVTLLVWLAARRARWALAALILVTTVDLAAWGIQFVYREPPRRIRHLTAAVPPAPDDPADAYAAAPDRGPYARNVLLLRGYRLTSGYVGLFPAAVHPLDSERTRRLSGTRWNFTPAGTRRPADDGVERARLLDGNGEDAADSVQLVVDRPGRIVVRVREPGERILALTERFHDGWSAMSGDTPLQTVRVHGDFLGCVLQPGVRRVEFRFMPRSFVYGSAMSAMGAAILIGILIARPR